MRFLNGEQISFGAIAPCSAQTATAAAAAAVSIILPASVGVQNILQFVAVSASGAASGPITLTVQDGATNILVLDLSLAVGATQVLSPQAAIGGTAGNTMTVTASAPAAGSVLKVNVGSYTT